MNMKGARVSAAEALTVLCSLGVGGPVSIPA
jgi:hypothetical protein